jgi:polyhydroxybutyrate depolymerase
LATSDNPAARSDLKFVLTTSSDTENRDSPKPVAEDDLGGCVFDSSGTPIVGATVTILFSNPARNQQSTGGDGFFRFPHFGNTWYFALKIEKAGFATRWIVDFPLGKWFGVRLENSTRLSGEIFMPDRSPATGATISVSKSKMSHRPQLGLVFGLQTDIPVDPRGHFDVPLEPGDYRLVAKGPGEVFASMAAVHLDPGKVREEAIKLSPGVHIKVRTVDIVTGKPVPGVRLSFGSPFAKLGASVHDPTSERTTNDAGIAEWSSARPSIQELAVDAPGYASLRSKLNLNPTGPNWGFGAVELDLQPGMPEVPIEMQPGMRVTGMIVDANGKPTPNVSINVRSIIGEYSSHNMSEEGTFDFTIPVTTVYGKSLGMINLTVTKDPNDLVELGSSEKFMPEIGATKKFRIVINPESAETASEYLMVGGVNRHYLMVVPSSKDWAQAFPVVFVFHPKNTDAALIEHGLAFPELAQQRRFIAVFPDGLDHQWNGGREKAASAASESSDDVAFVAAILDSVGSRYRIDPKRIYATGISNGAIFCYTLAARMSDRIAAIGPVAGAVGISIPEKFTPAQPVSVIAFNGTDDTYVPYRGYPDPDAGLLSCPDSIAFWVKADGCSEKPEITPLPRVGPDDGTNVVRYAFENGAHHSAVVSYVIAHGGHTWPGQRSVPNDPKGRSTMSVDATKEILDFFDQHPKP